MERDFSQGILEKIKTEKIKPKSRWHYVLKDYVVWFAFALSIVLGSVAFSIILHFFEVNDWDAYYRLNDNFLAFILLTLPYFWLAGFALCLYVAYRYLKSTREGYRYEFAKVLALTLLFSLMFGSLLYSYGVGREVENEFANRAPFYRDLRNRQELVWFNPDQGVLAGRVVAVDENGEFFELDDPNQVLWTVDVRDAYLMEGFMVREGFMVKVFGEREGDYLFVAEEVRPLMRERGPMPMPPSRVHLIREGLVGTDQQ